MRDVPSSESEAAILPCLLTGMRGSRVQIPSVASGDRVRAARTKPVGASLLVGLWRGNSAKLGSTPGFPIARNAEDDVMTPRTGSKPVAGGDYRRLRVDGNVTSGGQQRAYHSVRTVRRDVPCASPMASIVGCDKSNPTRGRLILGKDHRRTWSETGSRLRRVRDDGIRADGPVVGYDAWGVVA